MRAANEAGTRRIGVKLLVALVVIATAVGPFWLGWGTPEKPAAELPPYRPLPVPANRGADVTDGFRGDVHPALHGHTRLNVAAHWTPLGRGRDQLEKAVTPTVYRLLSDLKAAAPQQVYTERELSAWLPRSIEAVGQVWEIGLDEAAVCLRQFHPNPSLHSVAFGRRAGPDGAFGVLRAVSATHLEIVIRVHAEFDIAQNVWLTPACFWGRMVVDKQAGTVESFRLWVPTAQPLNVHLTVAESTPKGGTPQQRTVFRDIQRGDVVHAKRDIVRVEQMELVSENQELADSLVWSEEIDMEQAQHKLQQAFYTFARIGWVPWQQALTVAAVEHKPILAIVLWGALDDQSC